MIKDSADLIGMISKFAQWYWRVQREHPIQIEPPARLGSGAPQPTARVAAV